MLLRVEAAVPGHTWLPWAVRVRGWCSIWGPVLSVGGSSLAPAAFLLLQGLTAACRGAPWASGSCWLPALLAGGRAESAVLGDTGREAGPVGGEDLGQGQRTPGLLAQGPPEASLGAQGRGGEGEVLWLELELQVAGGRGVVCLSGGLRGGQGTHANTGTPVAPRGAGSPHGREIRPKGLPQSWGGGTLARADVAAHTALPAQRRPQVSPQDQ